MSTTRLVPPRRLGTLLRQARVAAGLDLAELAAATPLSPVALDDVEHGRRALDEHELFELLVAYGVEDAGLVPDRAQLVIDLDEGCIAVHDGEPELFDERSPDAVLARYLALVYRLRGLPVGSGLELREVDLGVLSTALALDNAEVADRLRCLIDECTPVRRDQRRIRRQLLIPIAGVVVAATTLGTLLLVAERDEAPRPDPVATVVDEGAPRVADAAVVDAAEVSTDIGNGGAVEENTGGG